MSDMFARGRGWGFAGTRVGLRGRSWICEGGVGCAGARGLIVGVGARGRGAVVEMAYCQAPSRISCSSVTGPKRAGASGTSLATSPACLRSRSRARGRPAPGAGIRTPAAPGPGLEAQHLVGAVPGQGRAVRVGLHGLEQPGRHKRRLPPPEEFPQVGELALDVRGRYTVAGERMHGDVLARGDLVV